MHRKNQETKAFRSRNVDPPIRKGINSLSRDAGLCSPVLQGFSPGAAMPAGRSSDEVSQYEERSFLLTSRRMSSWLIVRESPGKLTPAA